MRKKSNQPVTKKLDLFPWISTILLFDFVIAGYLFKVHWGFSLPLLIAGTIAFFWPAWLISRIFFRGENQLIDRLIILPVILIFLGYLFGKSESFGNLFNFEHALLYSLLISTAGLLFDLFFGAKIRKKMQLGTVIFKQIDNQKVLALFGLGMIAIFIGGVLSGDFGSIDNDLRAFSTEAINLEKFSEIKPNQMIISKSQTKVAISSNIILWHSLTGFSLPTIFKLGEVLLAAYIFPVYAFFKYFWRKKEAFVFIMSFAFLVLPFFVHERFGVSIEGLILLLTFCLVYFLVRMLLSRPQTALFYLGAVILTLFVAYFIDTIPWSFWIFTIATLATKLIIFSKISGTNKSKTALKK